MVTTTEKLTHEYAASFLHRLLHDTVPFQFQIGGTPAADHMGPPTGEATCQTRTASIEQVAVSAKYQMLGDAVEISITLTNDGDANSPQIHDIDFCNILLPDVEPWNFSWGRRRVLYSIGSPAAVYDFQPREEDLTRPEQLVLTEAEGRSSNSYMPYFNCSSLDREGVIAAIGWSGRWKAQFTNGSGGMRIRLSYPGDFYLEPGETIELPRVLLMPWKREKNADRDLWDTFVLFRRLMRKHILPKRILDGKITLRAWGSDSMDMHRTKLANMQKFGVTCDAYGIDAGWYAPAGSNWWNTVGDWQEDASVFPDGLEWLTARAREAGSKGFWLWLEFERAMSASKAYQAHPEHYLTAGDPNVHMINLCDPAAREYMKSMLYPLIRRIGLTMFRVDFNFDPVPYFAAADLPGRSGLTELKYYAGLYQFFQELMAAFPDLYIDNCASGGRRLDYRMCTCAIPINCRSDYYTIAGYDPDGQQAHTVGLSRWLPVHGEASGSMTFRFEPPKDTYIDRSAYGSNFSLVAFTKEMTDEEGALYRKIVDEAALVKGYLTQDFYPLTGYSYSPMDWCAFEGCMEDGSGAVVLAFRRELNPSPQQTFAVQGLKPEARYALVDLDDGELGTCTGAALARGLTIHIEKPRDSRIVVMTEVPAADGKA